MKKEIRKEEDSSYPYSLYIDGYFVNSYRKKKDIPTMRDMRINIMGERKAQNVAKELGIELRIIHGDWNGYGCPIIGRTVSGREYSKIMKIVDAKPSRPALTEEEKTEKWAKRLSKLTGI